MTESISHDGTPRRDNPPPRAGSLDDRADALGTGERAARGHRAAHANASPDKEAKDRTAIRRKIQDLLREEDSRSFTGSLGVFLSGVGTCLVGGIVFATVLALGLGAFRDEEVKPLITWRGWFGIYILVVAVLVFLRERKSHSKQIVESFSPADADPAHDAHASATAPAQVVTHAVTNAWSTLMHWGPDSVVDGLAGLRGKWTARQNAVFKRAAQMLVTLAKYDGAVGIPYLVRPPEDMRIFAAAVEWMEKNMWLGRSSDGERLYISSPGKQKLHQRNLIPAQKVKIVSEGGGSGRLPRM
jgi:hypothetical protein